MLHVQACRHSSSEPILDRWTHQHEEGTMPLSLALAAGVLLCWVTDECCRLSHCSTYPFGCSLTSSLVNNLYRRQRHPLAVSSEHLWGKQVRWRDVSAVTVAVLQRTPVIGSSAHYSNCIVFHTAWNGLIKDEGDILSSQVNTKTNQISEKKNSYCCNMNPNFHQMQPWDIMCILLLWSITHSFSSHQQLVSGGASEERSICLLLDLVIFLGVIFCFNFGFPSFLHSLSNYTVSLFYFWYLVLSVLF